MAILNDILEAQRYSRFDSTENLSSEKISKDTLDSAYGSKKPSIKVQNDIKTAKTVADIAGDLHETALTAHTDLSLELHLFAKMLINANREQEGSEIKKALTDMTKAISQIIKICEELKSK